MPRGKPFPKGESPNPGGRPALTEEQKTMRSATLAQALKIMHAKVHDKAYIAKLKPHDLHDLLALAFDRCGLPKVTTAEIEPPGDGDAVFSLTFKT